MAPANAAVVTADVPGIACDHWVSGTKASAVCRGTAREETYRVKAVCIAGNNTYTFVKYGPWKGVGLPDVSTVDCGARVLSVTVQFRV
ncbi:hypothetical protein OG357_12715 [Streptomyces sp. NBC_01255]|uniref:hypothetical protein n=1 Tax=Streptomyces sp. NBC_01255 TaxID=2903798 RepID=UPI002E326F46|nr:hypothetical protein [Streptomyces sp. NBC_01255]